MEEGLSFMALPPAFHPLL